MKLEQQVRKCTGCKEVKPLSIEFFCRVTSKKSAKKFHGFQYHCRACVNKYSKARDRRQHWKDVAARRDPAKQRARFKTMYAIRTGKLKRQKCFCGEAKVDAHHPDYSKPLEVIFLCKTHHARIHSPNFTNLIPNNQT